MGTRTALMFPSATTQVMSSFLVTRYSTNATLSSSKLYNVFKVIASTVMKFEISGLCSLASINIF